MPIDTHVHGKRSNPRFLDTSRRIIRRKFYQLTLNYARYAAIVDINRFIHNKVQVLG